jgi:sugar lactone lactonase YvrE
MILRSLAGLGALLLLYLLFWPVPIDPGAWDPPEVPALEGIYEQNNLLASVERLGSGIGIGPEHIAVDDQGRLYAGVEDGRIVRIQPDGSQPETFADPGGRALGLEFDGSGNLIVADAYKGLLSIAPNGSITVLSTEAEGVPFGFTNELDVAADGTIYFTDASFKFPLDRYTDDLMEHRPNGRFLAYDPATATTQVLISDLHFANGVAVAPDQTSVLLAEMGKYRIWRYWISGTRAGQSEIVIDNLPGFPDNLTSNGEGIFWFPLVSPRLSDVDNMMLPNPFLRRVIMRLPESMLPEAENYGFVLGIDIEGNVIHNLQDPAAAYTQRRNGA